MSKREKIMLAIVCVIILAFACVGRAQSGKIFNTPATTISSTQIITQTSETEKSENAVVSTTAEDSTKSTAKTTTTSNDKTTASSTAKATSSTTAKATEKQTSSKPSTTKKKQTATQAENCCYITVECKSVLKKMDKLKEGHEEFVPSNGIIISKTKCAFEDGDSVYDVLKKVCKNKGVKLTSRNTTYGVYVSGINNLDEFDCGKQSGWVYTVNGSSPAYSCGKYTVKEKNEIVFKYVC
ncbi:MAG: DUF4430 domain-containing protein [Eubacterium sp.]|nr:DUF4430 domain-containing protein [Eubacterium sp.]